MEVILFYSYNHKTIKTNVQLESINEANVCTLRLYKYVHVEYNYPRLQNLLEAKKSRVLTFLRISNDITAVNRKKKTVNVLYLTCTCTLFGGIFLPQQVIIM